MHSNTTSFAVSAFAPPHTIKVPIKGHYGFSTRSNRRESSSTARTLRAHRCLLCCHPKELRLIRKLYDHNYWSKLKCNNNINSEDGNRKVWAIPVSEDKWDYQKGSIHPEEKSAMRWSSAGTREFFFLPQLHHKREAFPWYSPGEDASIQFDWEYQIKNAWFSCLSLLKQVYLWFPQPQSSIDVSSQHRWKRRDPYLPWSIRSPPYPHTSSTWVRFPWAGPKIVMGFRFWVPILLPSDLNERVKFSLGQTIHCCRGLW